VCDIWQFTQIWNVPLRGELSNPASPAITVALAQLAGRRGGEVNLPHGGALLRLPTLLVYIVFGGTSSGAAGGR